MTMNAALRHPRAPTVLALVFSAVFIAGFLPTLLSLHRRWSTLDEAYSHGYLLLLLAVYLFWQSSPPPPDAEPPRPVLRHVLRHACIAIAAGASLIWLLFLLAGISAIQQLMLPVIAFCCIGAVGGYGELRRAIIPCALMYLAIPVWDEVLTVPLQTLSTAVAGWTIRHLFGIPVGIDGFHIQIPAGTFEIQGGCSGLVFLLTALTLGIAYGQLFLHTPRARATCIVSAAVLGMIVNWIRIISLILIGHHTAMRSSLIGEGHLMFGFYIFGAIALAVIFIASRFNTASAPQPTHPPATTTASDAPTVSTLLLTLAALALGPLTLALLRGHDTAPDQLAAPTAIGVSLQQVDSAWRPDFPAAPLTASYRVIGDDGIHVHIVHYANPFGDGKLVSQRNHPLPATWKIQQRSAVPLQNGEEALESRVIDDQGRPLLVWSWYQIGEDIVATESAARVALLRNALRLRLDGSFVSIATYCIFPDCALSGNALQRHAARIRDDVSAWSSTLAH